MMITMDTVDLIQEEISSIKTRHATKQLAFALLFKWYQGSYQFIDDLTKVPNFIINKLAKLLDVPPTISKVSSRTYDNYISLIRKYFKTTFSKKMHYKELEEWIKNELLPTHYLAEEEIKNIAVHYLKERGIESFKEKTMARIILDAHTGKIKRICYEVYVLKKLADCIRCREIWSEGSFKHRNQDEHLPNNFEENKEEYFDDLSLSLDGDVFIAQLKKKLTGALTALNDNIPKNPNVRISHQNGGRSIVTSLTPQAESKNIGIIKKHLQEKWEGTNLIDMFKEVDLENRFTHDFISYGRAGEISSNHEKAQTLSVMSLHLLQLYMVYINTLMIQQIIEELGLKDQLTKEDKRALTPLIYEHVNPYGLFPLDLSTRLPHLDYKVAG